MAVIGREFRELPFESIAATLSYPAPNNVFISYRLSNGYRIINNFFWEKINLKLNKCKAHIEFVDPIKDKIIDDSHSWYKTDKYIFLGNVIIFTFGACIGAYVRGK